MERCIHGELVIKANLVTKKHGLMKIRVTKNTPNKLKLLKMKKLRRLNVEVFTQQFFQNLEKFLLLVVVAMGDLVISNLTIIFICIVKDTLEKLIL